MEMHQNSKGKLQGQLAANTNVKKHQVLNQKPVEFKSNDSGNNWVNGNTSVAIINSKLNQNTQIQTKFKFLN